MLDATDWQMLLKFEADAKFDQIQGKKGNRFLEETKWWIPKMGKKSRCFPDATSEKKKNASWDDP